MGVSGEEVATTEELTRSLDETDPCAEEILRAFVSAALDELNYPFVENLPVGKQDDWLAIRYYLRAVEERLERINTEQHH
jgi:hypothetical protein